MHVKRLIHSSKNSLHSYRTSGTIVQPFLGCPSWSRCVQFWRVGRQKHYCGTYTIFVSLLVLHTLFVFLWKLAHPILDSLRGGEKEWTVNLLYAFNSGMCMFCSTGACEVKHGAVLKFFTSKLYEVVDCKFKVLVVVMAAHTPKGKIREMPLRRLGPIHCTTLRSLEHCKVWCKFDTIC